MSRKTTFNSAEERVGTDWGKKFKRLIQRYPGSIFGGMLFVMLVSAVWMFAFKQREPTSIGLLIGPSKIGLDTISAKLPSISSTHTALTQVLDLQSQIQLLIDKDSLTTSDSLLLIDALERFESIQKSMQLNNASP